VTPASGPNEGGTQVAIQGDGFADPLQVLFGKGTTASQFDGIEAQVISISRTRVVVRTPPALSFGQDLQNKLVDILVKNLDNGKFAVATSAYKYGVSILVTAISPGEGPTSGGFNVTIFGQGFDEPVAVEMGTVAQAPISVSGTEIVVIASRVLVTSCSDVTGPTKVTNIETGDHFDTGPVFRYRVLKPLIANISPTSGSPGTPITINGSGFFVASPPPGVRVVFGGSGGSTASVSSNTSTQIKATVPSAPAGFSFDTEPCDSNGDGEANGTRLIPTAIDVMVINLDGSTCSDTFTNGFLLTPPNTTCTGDTSTPPEPIVASFTVSIAPNPSLTAIFNDTSTGGPTSWSWNFGDPASGGANTSAVQSPSHTFSAPGTYTVTLTASNGSATGTASQFVTVPAP
jgi:PKD repeat protein